ncbi:Crp/Fnr family transcriptional regulator [uncultured Prevotella sp.]|uniref:Crp/Fnr family transcriptional regulator n=1 Tax=uncultured Prevotella sp. TaxID=159272 RepID=UPI00266D43AF|nr:Crp/Fnr family transcriptional regulator [uncultured Prevotella sp.]
MPIETLLKKDIANSIAQIWHCTDVYCVNTIQKNLTVRSFKRNELIYQENETPTHILFLVNGMAKIIKECGMGRSQIVRIIKEQSFIGFRAFFAHECNSTSAVALEDSTVAALPLDTMVELIELNHGITNYFISELATKLGETDSRFVTLTQKHIRGRLAETIIALKANYGIENDGKTLNVIMNRYDLASLSNMSTSNAIRTLSSFATEGLIEISGRKIRILNEEELAKISRLG